MERMKLLIDTDPGVDDALAIMLAHNMPTWSGLTIAAGNVGLAHTVANALKLVEVIGADTPVFAGCANPLVLPAADAAFVHGNDGFGEPVTCRASARRNASTRSMRSCVCRTSTQANS